MTKNDLLQRITGKTEMKLLTIRELAIIDACLVIINEIKREPMVELMPNDIPQWITNMHIEHLKKIHLDNRTNAFASPKIHECVRYIKEISNKFSTGLMLKQSKELYELLDEIYHISL